jgi:selenocysteine lyase/cysteine desulfurase
MHPEFPQTPGLIYLNHAAVSPWPSRTARAISDFALENLTEGARQYPRWSLAENYLREQLKTLLGASSTTEIALVKNTSEAISFVAMGLTWHSGDNIVGTAEEFPSNRIPWEALASQGVHYRQPDLQGPDPEAAIIEAIDENTRLVAVSSVQYASGLRLNLERIGKACRQAGCLFLVDAIQSLGAFPLHVEKIQADFVMADGHKWLLAPEGLGVFYIRASALDRVRPTQFGWHMIEKMGDYDTRSWEVAHSARRFECGSPNMLGIHGLSASLAVLLEEGISKVASEILSRSAILERLIENEPTLELLSSTQPERRSGIVLFRHRTLPQVQVWKHLKNHHIVCALRGGGIRFSPHFYTPIEQLQEAVTLAAASH